MDNPRREPDFIDILIVCWGLFVIIILSASIWSQGTGNGEYIITNTVIFIAAWYYLKARRQPQIIMFRLRPVPRRVIPSFVLMALSSAVLLDEIDRLIQLIIHVPEEYAIYLNETFKAVSFGEAILILFGVVIIAPIVEESLFRGFIQQTLERKRDVTKAVLITSMIFALIHFQPWLIIQLLILAVLLGYLAWRWSSIIPAVLVHMANNLLQLINITSQDSVLAGVYLMNNHVNPLIIISSIIVLVVSFRASERTGRTPEIRKTV